MTGADLISYVYMSNNKKGKNIKHHCWHFSLNMPNSFWKLPDNQIDCGPGITKAIWQGPAPNWDYMETGIRLSQTETKVNYLTKTYILT